MLLFKTSANTINSVVANQKHAFKGQPQNWESGEIILVSKNRNDCRPGEKKIQYIMFLDNIRQTGDKEFEKYWPNNKRRWKYIAD
jgi:5-methylcytosine-specific restriction protein A